MMNVMYQAFNIAVLYFLDWDQIQKTESSLNNSAADREKIEKQYNIKLKNRRLLLFNQLIGGNNYIYILFWYTIIDFE